jgi:hypothetical protein
LTRALKKQAEDDQEQLLTTVTNVSIVHLGARFSQNLRPFYTRTPISALFNRHIQAPSIS